MAKETRIVLTDDLHGGPADQTVRFGYEGTDYEIDLNQENADHFALFLEPYIAAARKVRAARKASTPATANPTAVRAWARANGWPNLGDKGRLASEILNAYEARVR